MSAQPARRDWAEFNTNIKNLPGGREYFTEIGYSQQYPWALVKRTPKTATIAPVKVRPDPDFKPDWHPGGFAGHVSNQHAQTWLFDGIDFDRPRTIRLTLKGWSLHGTLYVSNRAIYFYDYNF